MRRTSARDEPQDPAVRLEGHGFPQMPAGGLSPENLQEVQTWIRDGAAIPQ